SRAIPSPRRPGPPRPGSSLSRLARPDRTRRP
ncbi:anti-sigma factor antagonist, partial [Streptomyces albidoflavus]